MVLDVEYDSDLWFAPLDLNNKSLMEKFTIWISMLGIQAYMNSVQTKQRVPLAYSLVRPVYLVRGIFASWAKGLGILLGLGL